LQGLFSLAGLHTKKAIRKHPGKGIEAILSPDRLSVPYGELPDSSVLYRIEFVEPDMTKPYLSGTFEEYVAKLYTANEIRIREGKPPIKPTKRKVMFEKGAKGYFDTKIEKEYERFHKIRNNDLKMFDGLGKTSLSDWDIDMYAGTLASEGRNIFARDTQQIINKELSKIASNNPEGKAIIDSERLMEDGLRLYDERMRVKYKEIIADPLKRLSIEKRRKVINDCIEENRTAKFSSEHFAKINFEKGAVMRKDYLGEGVNPAPLTRMAAEGGHIWVIDDFDKADTPHPRFESDAFFTFTKIEKGN